MKTEFILITIIAIVAFVFIGHSIKSFIKTTADFFIEAYVIEDLIKSNAPQDEVIKALFSLKKKSFHRRTGMRIKELSKMVEVKYNTIIIDVYKDQINLYLVDDHGDKGLIPHYMFESLHDKRKRIINDII